jgi:putative pyoverdin transport system ATP-binding/permease protein
MRFAAVAILYVSIKFDFILQLNDSVEPQKKFTHLSSIIMKTVFKEIWAMAERFKLLSYFILGILTAALDFLFVNTVAKLIAQISTKAYTVVSRDFIIMFLLIVFLIVWTRRVSSTIVIKVTQKLIWRYRDRIVGMVLHSNVEQLVKRKNKVFSAIAMDVNSLTNASMNAVPFLTALLMSIACMVYLATISITLFVITFSTALLASTIYYYGSRIGTKHLEATRDMENEFMKNLRSILDGYKEIFMNARIGKSIYENKIKKIATKSYQKNVFAFVSFLNNQIIGQISFYILLTFILLYFSITLNIQSTDIIRFVFVLMYLSTSVQTVMALLPMFLSARVARDHMITLQKDLDNMEHEDLTQKDVFSNSSFYKIDVHGLRYQYGADGNFFNIGPIDFSIESGDVVFISGGNGCGKTTFMNSLLGVLTPGEGQIILNEQLVTKNYRSQYRACFSVVFSDFYLFDEVHGVENVDEEKWQKYLELFELEGKVTLNGKKYSVTDLSTGQRKRLALVTALLQDRPFLVLDEWAADQDSVFRRKFYTEIIPFLKAENRGILAITHDDKYYYCADRLYKMEDGKLHEKTVDVPVLNEKV